MVAIARRIIEEEGVDALSMRRVAKELGSTPMALYHYVQDKDELLMLTLSGTAAAFPVPNCPRTRASGCWPWPCTCTASWSGSRGCWTSWRWAS